MGPDTGKMKDASLLRPFASLLTSVSRCVYLYLRDKAEKSFMLLCASMYGRLDRLSFFAFKFLTILLGNAIYTIAFCYIL